MLNFPSSPTVGDAYTSGGKTWRWDGVAWVPDFGGVSKAGDTMSGNLLIARPDWADLTVRAIGVGGDGATMHGQFARGTAAAPTTPIAGDALYGIGARPYAGPSGYTAHSIGAIHFFARENISETAQGASVRVAVVPVGGTWADRIHAIRFECDGVGQGPRWRAKFSGSSLNSRGYVQDDSGGATSFGVMSGATSGSSANINIMSRSDADNSPYLQFGNYENLAQSRIYSGASGGATALPLVLGVGAQSGAVLINEAGQLLVTGSSLGYGPGSGGSVTQPTSKSTPVTLNKPSGQIALNNSALAAGASAMFALNNSHVGLGYNDVVVVNAVANTKYQVSCIAVDPGVAYIRITNITTGSLSEAVSINFAVIKTAVA